MIDSTTSHRDPDARVKRGADVLEIASRLFAKYGDIELDLSRNYTERPPVDFKVHMTGRPSG